jgi:thiamine pyrophosphokinase
MQVVNVLKDYDTLIITGGRMDVKAIRRLLDDLEVMKSDKLNIIAVDGGIERADELGIKPTHIIGDFDTVDPDVLKRYMMDESIQVDSYRPEKDETDTELAADLCKRLESKKVLIIGALGGRMDHELSNIFLLEKFNKYGIMAAIADELNVMFYMTESFDYEKLSSYKYFSLISLSEKIEGLNISGCKYTLSNGSLNQFSSLCISNEITDEQAEVKFKQGKILVISSRDRFN